MIISVARSSKLCKLIIMWLYHEYSSDDYSSLTFHHCFVAQSNSAETVAFDSVIIDAATTIIHGSVRRGCQRNKAVKSENSSRDR